jgi:hypothetical protein
LALKFGVVTVEWSFGCHREDELCVGVREERVGGEKRREGGRGKENKKSIIKRKHFRTVAIGPHEPYHITSIDI